MALHQRSLATLNTVVPALPPAELQGRLAAKEGDMQLELASRVAQVGRVGALTPNVGSACWPVNSIPLYLAQQMLD